MRQIFVITLLAAAAAACHPESTEPPPPPPETESRATAMPESLRCSKATDCMVQPSCYWDTPTCVAAATMVAPKCGTDADPPDAAPEIHCGCSDGQCVVN